MSDMAKLIEALQSMQAPAPAAQPAAAPPAAPAQVAPSVTNESIAEIVARAMAAAQPAPAAAQAPAPEAPRPPPAMAPSAPTGHSLPTQNGVVDLFSLSRDQLKSLTPAGVRKNLELLEDIANQAAGMPRKPKPPSSR